MDATVIVGIDVSKDRLDVHVRPGRSVFWVSRDGDGIASLVEQLGRFSVKAVAVEATGGFEKVVAVGLLMTVTKPAKITADPSAVSSSRR
jgi:transposase